MSVNPCDPGALRAFLDDTYTRFNRPEFIAPDPLEVARGFAGVEDREIAALIASSLAVGRAGLIAAACRDVMARMGERPRAFVEASNFGDMDSAFTGFRYRFFSGTDVAALLSGARGMIREYGSLGAAFSAFTENSGNFALRRGAGEGTAAAALEGFVRGIREGAAIARGLPGESVPFAKNLLPAPSGGSACKRPFLMLRWLVRRDAVDPGGWDSSLAPTLVQPMDTHMGWVARRLGLIPENAPANLATALAVTARFRVIAPADPVRYDFALTRPGIRPDLDRAAWFPGPDGQ